MDTSPERTVRNCIAQAAPLAREVGDVHDNLLLRDDLGLDSLTLVGVVLGCAEALNVNLVEEGRDLASVQTVGDLIHLFDGLVIRG